VELKFLLIPLIGAFIGYITNYLAVKMLFRPLKPVYLFGFKLPFTPGLIPREKERLINEVATLVAREIFSPQKIISFLKKTEFEKLLYQRVSNLVDNFIQENSDEIKQAIKSAISLGKLNIKGFFIATAFEKVVEKIFETLTEKLKEKLKSKILQFTEKQLEEELTLFIQSIDFKQIVYESLSSLSDEELERLILSVSKKHLQYINLFGAVVGFFIGVIQVLILIFI